MEYRSLPECLQYVKHVGININAEKTQLLKHSLSILTKENHFIKTYYWGRINGTHNDYHIAYGHGKNYMKGRVYYYYSQNCIDWMLLPKFNEPDELSTTITKNLFTGDPSYIVNIKLISTPISENKTTEESTNTTDSIEKTLREDIRLAVTVQQINEFAMIAPRDSLLKHSNGNITKNPAFTGLTSSEAIHLQSYLLYRCHENKWQMNTLTKADNENPLNAFESIDIDVSKDNYWSFQLHTEESLVILQNLRWPGMTFYHLLNSPHYGSIYIGNGQENLNAPFMI